MHTKDAEDQQMVARVMERQRQEAEVDRMALQIVREELEQYSVNRALTTEEEIKAFFESYVECYSIDKLWNQISNEMARLPKKINSRQPVLRLIIANILGISTDSFGPNILFQIICYDYLSKKIQVNDYRIESTVGFKWGFPNSKMSGTYRIWASNREKETGAAIKIFNFTALLGDYLDNETVPSPFATTLIAVPTSSLETIISTISTQDLNKYIPGACRLRGKDKIDKEKILKKLNTQLEWCGSADKTNMHWVSMVANELNQYFTIPEIFTTISDYLEEVFQSAKEGYEENLFSLAPSNPFLTMLYKRSLIPQPSAAPLFSTVSATIANTATGVVSTSITPTIPSIASTQTASNSKGSLLVLVASNTGAITVVDANKPTTITAIASNSEPTAFAAFKRKKKRKKK